jgi:hypothetical protein
MISERRHRQLREAKRKPLRREQEPRLRVIQLEIVPQ